MGEAAIREASSAASSPWRRAATRLPDTPPRGAIESQPHFRGLAETRPFVDPLRLVRGVEDHDLVPVRLGPADRRPNDEGCVPLPAMAPFRVHGHQVRRMVTRRPRAGWQRHDPQGAACGSPPPFRLDEERDVPARLETGPGPPSIRPVDRIELGRACIGNLLEHLPPVPDEQVEIADRRFANAGHGAATSGRAYSFGPGRRRGRGTFI